VYTHDTPPTSTIQPTSYTYMHMHVPHGHGHGHGHGHAMDMDMDMDMDMHRIAHVTYMCIPAARASACALNLKSVKGKNYAGMR
jgi:hypothetical protein